MKWNQVFPYKIIILLCILSIVLLVVWLICRHTEGLDPGVDNINLKKEYDELQGILGIITGNKMLNGSDMSLDQLSIIIKSEYPEGENISQVIQSITKYSNESKQLYKSLPGSYTPLQNDFSLLNKLYDQTNSYSNNLEKYIDEYDAINAALDDEYAADVDDDGPFYQDYLAAIQKAEQNYTDGLDEADGSYNILVAQATSGTNSSEYYVDIKDTNSGLNQWFHGSYSTIMLDPTITHEERIKSCMNICTQEGEKCIAFDLVETGDDPYCSLMEEMKNPRFWESIDPPHYVYLKKVKTTDISSIVDDRNNNYYKAGGVYEEDIKKAINVLNKKYEDRYDEYELERGVLIQKYDMLITPTPKPVDASQITDENYKKLYALVSNVRYNIISVVDELIPYVEENLPRTPSLKPFMDFYKNLVVSREGYTGMFPTSPMKTEHPPLVSSEDNDYRTSSDEFLVKSFKQYFNMRYNKSPISIYKNVDDVGRCIDRCTNKASCVGFNYDNSNNECGLFSEFDTTIPGNFSGSKTNTLYFSGSLDIQLNKQFTSYEVFLKNLPLTNESGNAFLNPNDLFQSQEISKAIYMSPNGDLQVFDISQNMQIWSFAENNPSVSLIPGSSAILTNEQDKQPRFIIYDYISNKIVFEAKFINQPDTNEKLQLDLLDNGNMVITTVQEPPKNSMLVWSSTPYTVMDISQFSNEPYCYVRNMKKYCDSINNQSLMSDENIQKFYTLKTFSKYMSDGANGSMNSEMSNLLPLVRQHYYNYGFLHNISKDPLDGSVDPYELQDFQYYCYATKHLNTNLDKANPADMAKEISKGRKDWFSFGFKNNNSYSCGSTTIPVLPRSAANCYYEKYMNNPNTTNDITSTNQQAAIDDYASKGFLSNKNESCTNEYIPTLSDTNAMCYINRYDSTGSQLTSLDDAYNNWSNTGFSSGRINTCKDNLKVGSHDFDISRLYEGQTLQNNEFIQSPNGTFRASFDTTKNFSIYNGSSIIWNLSYLKGSKSQSVINKFTSTNPRKTTIQNGVWKIVEGGNVVVSSLLLTGGRTAADTSIRLDDSGYLNYYDNNSSGLTTTTPTGSETGLLWSSRPGTSKGTVSTLYPDEFVSAGSYRLHNFYDDLCVVKNDDSTIVWKLSSYLTLTTSQGGTTTPWLTSLLPNMSSTPWTSTPRQLSSVPLFSYVSFSSSTGIMTYNANTGSLNQPSWSPVWSSSVIIKESSYELVIHPLGVIQTKTASGKVVWGSYVSFLSKSPILISNDPTKYVANNQITEKIVGYTPTLYDLNYNYNLYFGTEGNLQSTLIGQTTIVFGLSKIYGTTQSPSGLTITLKNGVSVPLNATATPTSPTLSQDSSGNIMVKDGNQAIVFCLEMVGVSYDTNTVLFLDGSGNWVVANNGKMTDPKYSWNSGTTPVRFIYNSSTNVYTYNNAAASMNNAILFTNGTHQNDTYTSYSYFDYSNIGYNSTQNTQPSDCQTQCLDDPRCMGYTYTNNNTCTFMDDTFKDKFALYEINSGATTYIDNTYSSPKNTSYNSYLAYANYGNDVKSFTIPASAPDIDAVCRKACDLHPDCKLCTVSHIDNSCWLKNEISSEGIKFDEHCNTYVSSTITPQMPRFAIEDKYKGYYLSKMGGTISETKTVSNNAWECSQWCDTKGDGCVGFYINDTQCSLYSQVSGKSPDSGGNTYAKFVGPNKAIINAYNKTNIWEKTEHINNFTVLQMTPGNWGDTGYVDIKLACEAEVYMIGGSGGGGSGASGSGENAGGAGGGGGTGYGTYGKFGPGTFSIRIGKGGEAAAASKDNSPQKPGGNGGSTYIVEMSSQQTIKNANGGTGGGGGWFRNYNQGQNGTGGTGGPGETPGSNGGDNGGSPGNGGSRTHNPLIVYSQTVSGGKGGQPVSQDNEGGNYNDYNGNPTGGTCGWIYIKYYD